MNGQLSNQDPKEDREYMRGFADSHLKTFHASVKKKKKVVKRKKTKKVGTTQRIFDKMKTK